MKRFLIILLLGLASSFNLRRSKQSYDSYVLAVTWPSGYCKASDCNGADSVVEKYTTTLHGLWPSLKSGKRLAECTTGVKVTDDGSSLFVKMRKIWPGFGMSNTDFWAHEYNKHGYCMVEEKGYSGYKDYFNAVVSLYESLGMKNLIKNAFPSLSTTTVKYDTMKTKIKNVYSNAVFQMRCTGGYISEFYFYLNLNLKPESNYVFTNSCASGKLQF